jgi:hypothetical protein
MKPAAKTSIVLAIGGIIVAGAFAATAVLKPEYLDRVLHPGEEKNEQVKKEEESKKEIDPDTKLVPPDKTSDGSPDEPENEAKGGSSIPELVPEKTARAGELENRGDTRISDPDCVSRDQIVRVIGASEEARGGRVVGIRVTPDGNRIMVDYRKKTFLGFGSGENQIERILQRDLRKRFPDSLIRSLTVRSAGKRSVRRGDQNINVEALEIAIPRYARRCVSASVGLR